MNRAKQMWRALKEIERVAAPASTLLWATLGATVLLTGLWATAHASPPPVAAEPVAAEGSLAPAVAWWPSRVVAGEQLAFAIELPAGSAPVAYLPGLDAARVPLSFDSATRRWRGALAVPADAPRRGHFTLRVVAHATHTEIDLRVPLTDPCTRSLSL